MVGRLKITEMNMAPPVGASVPAGFARTLEPTTNNCLALDLSIKR